MGKKHVTMNDIAVAAGVSQSSVSLILSGRADVSFSESTIARVHEAAKSLGYQAKTSSSNRSVTEQNILVLPATIGNPFYAVSTQSIEREARKHNLNVFICSTYHIPELEANYLRAAELMNFSGIIYLYPPDNKEEFQRISKKIHTVCICDNNSALDCDVVELDNFKSGQIAAAHLTSLGHKNIAFFTNSVNDSASHAQRYKGILSHLEEEGLSKHFSLCLLNDCPADRTAMSRYDYQMGYRLVKTRHTQLKDVTGIICINDTVAFGAIDALTELGYRVPEDYSVMGFDNTVYASLSGINLTSVEHHIDLFSQTTVNFLLHRFNRQQDQSEMAYSRFRFECQPNLIIRNSTAAPRAK